MYTDFSQDLTPDNWSFLDGDVWQQSHAIEPTKRQLSDSPTSTYTDQIPVYATPAITEPTTAMSSPKKPRKRQSDDVQDNQSSSSQSYGEPEDRVSKRQRNTEAARRYRQRKVDRVTELEEALAAMTKERDDLKLKLARSEAEADVLRGMVGKSN